MLVSLAAVLLATSRDLRKTVVGEHETGRDRSMHAAMAACHDLKRQMQTEQTKAEGLKICCVPSVQYPRHMRPY